MAINTNSVTDYGLTTSFSLSWAETTDINTNTSTLVFSVTTNQSPAGSGYKRTLTSGSVTINGVSYTVAGNSVYNGLEVWKKTIVIEHNSDGTKTITASLSMLVGGSDRLTGSGSIALTAIPRGSTMTLSTNNLSDGGDDLVITIIPNVASYSHVLKCWLNSEVVNTLNIAAGTTEVTYSNLTLSGYLGENYSGVATFLFELQTFNGSAQIGDSYYSDALFRKGFIALSLYQGADGTGLAAGHEANGPGIDLTFNDVNFTGSNVTGLSSSGLYTMNVSMTFNSLSASGYVTVTKDIDTPAGYIPLGILGVKTGSQVKYITNFYVTKLATGQTEIKVGICAYGHGSQGQTNGSVTVLFVKE